MGMDGGVSALFASVARARGNAREAEHQRGDASSDTLAEAQTGTHARARTCARAGAARATRAAGAPIEAGGAVLPHVRGGAGDQNPGEASVGAVHGVRECSGP